MPRPDQTTDTLPALLTPREVLRVLRLKPQNGPQALYRLRKAGRLPSTRIGKAFLYPKQGVCELLSGQR